MGPKSHPKEGVLRIYIALKNAWLNLGSNPLTLGPVAVTQTTTPQRRLCMGHSAAENDDFLF
jgi:hypothetical protein